MRFSVSALVLCACVCAAAADVAHIKGGKTKLLSRLAGKHHKRGVFTPVPPFKLGHDIPYVTHSVIKPLVVTYPPTASVAAVKIPVTGQHLPRYPVPVGHKVHGLPHPHYGLRFPHHKYALKPDHHFHHHHHHVAPKPVVPVVPVAHAAPVHPAPAPTVAVVNAAPPPPPPAPVLPAPPLPVPAPPVPLIPDHLHVKPLLPAAPVLPAPFLPFSQPLPYVIRPGGAVQTSLFATYPRYPFLNSYQAPLYPIAPAASPLPAPQVLQHLHPYHLAAPAGAHGVVEQHAPNVVVEQTPAHFHTAQLAPQPHVHLHPNEEALQHGFHLHSTQEGVPQPGLHLHQTQEALPQPGFHVNPTQEAVPQPGFNLHPVPEPLPQPGFHLHQTQEALPHPGFHVNPTQEAVPQPGFHLHPVPEPLPQPGFHLHSAQGIPLQPTQPSLDHDGWSPVSQNPAQPHDSGASHEGHYPQQGHHFTQEQGTQVYEQHTDQYHDYQHQLHHIQQQIEQAQYEQSLHTQQQPAAEYGTPQLGHDHQQANEYQGHDFGNQQDFSQNFAQQAHDFAQHAQEFAQYGQDLAQHAQAFSQNGQDFNQNNYNVAHLGQEYGVPHQGLEGRSSEDSEQQFHNHIPLGLQPPIDRPLDHFQ